MGTLPPQNLSAYYRGGSRNRERGVLYSPDQPLQLRHQVVGLHFY